MTDEKENLILNNMGLVHHVIKRYIRCGQDMEDLFQIGTIGLMKAVERYDENYGVCFSTYAVPLITGEIRRFLRDDGMVKISRSIKENIWKISRAREELNKQLGREPTMTELSQITQIDSEDIIVALDAGREVESIYQTVYQSDGNEIYLVDQISDDDKYNPRENDVINRLLVNELLDGLSEKERELIKLRYYDNQTQTQTAKKLGMTQVQVSRMEKKTLITMRKQINN